MLTTTTVTRPTANLEKVCRLYHEYKQDKNCRPGLWIADCVKHGECTQQEADVFLSMARDDERLQRGLEQMERLHP